MLKSLKSHRPLSGQIQSFGSRQLRWVGLSLLIGLMVPLCSSHDLALAADTAAEPTPTPDPEVTRLKNEKARIDAETDLLKSKKARDEALIPDSPTPAPIPTSTTGSKVEPTIMTNRAAALVARKIAVQLGNVWSKKVSNATFEPTTNRIIIGTKADLATWQNAEVIKTEVDRLLIDAQNLQNTDLKRLTDIIENRDRRISSSDPDAILVSVTGTSSGFNAIAAVAAVKSATALATSVGNLVGLFTPTVTITDGAVTADNQLFNTALLQELRDPKNGYRFDVNLSDDIMGFTGTNALSPGNPADRTTLVKIHDLLLVLKTLSKENNRLFATDGYYYDELTTITAELKEINNRKKDRISSIQTASEAVDAAQKAVNPLKAKIVLLDTPQFKTPSAPIKPATTKPGTGKTVASKPNNQQVVNKAATSSSPAGNNPAGGDSWTSPLPDTNHDPVGPATSNPSGQPANASANTSTPDDLKTLNLSLAEKNAELELAKEHLNKVKREVEATTTEDNKRWAKLNNRSVELVQLADDISKFSAGMEMLNQELEATLGTATTPKFSFADYQRGMHLKYILDKGGYLLVPTLTYSLSSVKNTTSRFAMRPSFKYDAVATAHYRLYRATDGHLELPGVAQDIIPYTSDYDVAKLVMSNP